MFDDNPTAPALESFLKEMHTRRVQWLGQQVLLASGVDLPSDLKERLQWLRAAGLLSQSEYDTLLASVGGEDVTRPSRLH